MAIANGTAPVPISKKRGKQLTKPVGTCTPSRPGDQVGYFAAKLTAPELTAKEMELLRAYRTCDGEAQQMLLSLAMAYAKMWPRFETSGPALSLVMGGHTS